MNEELPTKDEEQKSPLLQQIEEDKQASIAQDDIDSEWESVPNSEPVLLSDFEHKAFLVNPSKGQPRQPDDILDKDFSLSILDTDQTFIYGIKGTCAEEWLHLGFANLSARRKQHLKIKLGIIRSTAGIERFLQTGVANVSTEMDLLNNQIKPDQAVEKKTGSGLSGVKKWFS